MTCWHPSTWTQSLRSSCRSRRTVYPRCKPGSPTSSPWDAACQASARCDSAVAEYGHWQQQHHHGNMTSLSNNRMLVGTTSLRYREMQLTADEVQSYAYDYARVYVCVWYNSAQQVMQCVTTTSNTHARTHTMSSNRVWKNQNTFSKYLQYCAPVQIISDRLLRLK